MTVRKVFLQAKGVCADCGYPAHTHRGDCPRVAVVTVPRAAIETLRLAAGRRQPVQFAKTIQFGLHFIPL